MVTTRSTRSSSRSFAGPPPPPWWRGVWHAYAENDFVLRKEQMERLSEHKYSSIDTSWLDELCMKEFWERVVQLCPLWLAPNLITLIGLLVNSLCLLVFSLHCPTASEEAPSWVYFLAALGLFVYQTLDAIDGKQARRTGSASPLGELFDHGCDSMSQIMVTLTVCLALRLGELGVFGVFPVCIISMAVFYVAHWSTYCTGRLQFAKFDVTEAQVVIMGVLCLTGCVGPAIWSIGVGSLELRVILLLGCFVGLLKQLCSYVDVIMNGGCGRNGATVADTSVIFPLCPLLAVVLPFCMIHSKASEAVYQDNIVIFALFFGAVAAKATNRVIVAYMSRSELYIWDWIYVGPLLVILNQYWNLPLPEVPLLYFATLYAYASLLLYCVFVTRQLCQHLHISCFVLPPHRD